MHQEPPSGGFFLGKIMEIIKITNKHKFLWECESGISDKEKESVVTEWNKLFPDNPLIVVPKGMIKLLELE